MTKNFKELVGDFKNRKILVLGDVMLDLYIRGTVDRISPEAPVPVIVENRRDYVLGGAGNVAANVEALGGKVFLASVYGRDAEGKILKKVCRSKRIAPHFVSESGRPTTTKTRAVAVHHQLLRVDRESQSPIKSATENKLISLLGKVKDVDFVVVSDYAKGCVTEKAMRFLRRRFGGKKIAVGAKPSQAHLYKNVFLVVLNVKEAQAITGIHGDIDGRAGEAARTIGKKFGSSAIITRGGRGMTVYSAKNKHVSHIPAKALQVYDVTGAGDTVLASVVLALASGANLEEAAEVANRAAGVVVSIEGTATVSPKELLAAFRQK